jgi:PleD family two-component response regulator
MRTRNTREKPAATYPLFQSAGVGGRSNRETGMTEPLPTVFVVDDDASVRKSLARLLKSAGYRPESFASA